MKRVWRFVVAGLAAGNMALAAEEGGTQPAAERAASAPASRPAVVLPLARAPAQPLRRYTFTELRELFPAFEHEPFDTAGFNHLTLPFLYSSRDGGGDANEARAFAFLLSSALDWGEGCYCSRHAYFVFKRARRYMEPLAAGYASGGIAFAIRDWNATHAVGGMLVHTKEGYSGTLLIHDRTGEVARQVEYDKPREFFELLGDMAVDGLMFLDRAPSPELSKHLHAKQCTHRQSLIDLGKAAFAEERSRAEFDLYDAILRREPGFADVRAWRANQKWWMNGDDRAKALEMGKAIESHLVLLALEEFSPSKCPDLTLVAQYSLRRRQYEQLVGTERPWLITKELIAARGKRQVTAELLDRAARLAARNPNDYWFLCDVSKTWAYPDGAADCDTAVGFCLAALQNRYMTGVGHKKDAARCLADLGTRLGRSDLCADVLMAAMARDLEKGGPPAAWADATTLGEALFDMGRFEESIYWYRIAFQGAPAGSEEAVRALVGGAVSAAHLAREDALRQVLADRRELLERQGAGGLVEGYLDLLAGMRINQKAVWARPEPRPWWLERHLLIVTLQSDLLFREDTHWEWAERYCRNELGQRPFRILADQMWQLFPGRSADSFYHAAQWLHEDDPWASQAAAQWRQRVREPKLPEPEELLAAMSGFQPLRRPPGDPQRQQEAHRVHRGLRGGAVASAVRQLLEARKPDKAEELALRFLNVATVSDHYPSRVCANHLFHRIQRARKAMDGAIGPDDL